MTQVHTNICIDALTIRGEGLGAVLAHGRHAHEDLLLRWPPHSVPTLHNPFAATVQGPQPYGATGQPSRGPNRYKLRKGSGRGHWSSVEPPPACSRAPVQIWELYRFPTICHINTHHMYKHRIISHHVISYRIVSYRIASYRIASFRIASYRTAP